MKKYLAVLLCILPTLSFAAQTNYPEICAKIEATIENNTFTLSTTELGIDSKQIIRENTQVKILAINPVTPLLAEQYANAADANMRDIYFSIYREGNPLVMVVQYTYVNAKKQENVFISSAVVNDEECSVSFDKYLTVKREF